MFKFSSAINVAVATVLVVPALTLQGPQPASLEEALMKTVQALESLGGLEQRLAAHEPAAVGDVLRWTEPALPATAERDARLETLRHQVDELQAQYDALGSMDALAPVEPAIGDARATPHASATPKSMPELAPVSQTTTRELAPAPPTLGLDDERRNDLALLPSPRSASDKPATDASPDSAVQRTSFEPDGYAADPLRLGRAHFLRGNYAQGLAVLEPLANDPAATYWSARCLEKLGRTNDALEAYKKVVAAPNAGELAQRAQDDLDFLTWRSAFEKRLKDAPAGGRK